ncbi:YbaB/EbfC family nucleoid-associated protein [Demequina oxidasica]|uniref:YbaB/EbfC family nucleoid-associated protein n=1 Tax=Demequina oxidasica TaxID=676199 RepID=UPI0007807443|nr:YbaB/EbfC family nucleoid-associated protein [Demequina oxidasica]
MTEQPWADSDAAIAHVEEQIRQAQAQADKARALEADMKTILGRATSPHREVTAAVSANGLLTELKLTSEAGALHEDDLAVLIKKVVNDAHRAVGEQAVQLTAEAFGEDSGVTARLREEAAAREVPPAEPGITY